MKLKLVENWNKAYKWLSVHFIILLAAIPAVWETLPSEWKASVPSDTLAWVTGVVGVLGVYARLVSQDKGKPNDKSSVK